MSSDVDPVTKLRAFVDRANAAGVPDTDQEPISVGTLRALCVQLAEYEARLDYVRRLAPTFRRFGAVEPEPARDRDAERRAFIRQAAIALWARSAEGTDAREVWQNAEMLWQHEPEGDSC